MTRSRGLQLLALSTFATAPLAWGAVPTPLARELESRLVPPVDVVVLGNSKVRTDLDFARLQAALPQPAPHYVAMGLPGTPAPVWYAVLHERVYGTGVKPRGVLVYAPLQAALVTALPNAAARSQLAQQVQGTSPPSLLRLFGGALPDDLREKYLQAGGNVCDPDRTKAPELAKPVEPLPVRESFLAQIVAEATANGARVLFVRQPVGLSGALEDEVSPADEAAARGLVAAAGGGWIDLRGALGDERYFGDGVHMNEAGRRATTDVLARTLSGLGDWLGGAPLPAPAFAAPPPAPHWTTPPTPPPTLPFTAAGECEARATLPAELAPLGPEALRAAGFAGASPLMPALWAKPLVARAAGSSVECDARWRAEGATLVAAVPSAKQKGLKLVASADAAVRGDAGLAGWWVAPGATLHMDGLGGSVTVTGWAPMAGSLMVAGSPVVFSAGSVAFDAPAGPGGGVDLVGEKGWFLVRSAGDTPPVAPRALDLIGAPIDAALPPALPTLPLKGRAGRFPSERTADASALHVPEADDAFDASGVGACSPLRTDEKLRSSLRGTSLVVDSVDCAALTLTEVPVHLDPDRGCPARSHGRWLYPGDEQTWHTTVEGGGSGWAIELAGGVLGAAGGATLHVVVRDGKGELLDESVSLEDLRTDPPRLPLSRAPSGAVTVRVTVPASAPWVLLGRASLVAGRG